MCVDAVLAKQDIKSRKMLGMCAGLAITQRIIMFEFSNLSSCVIFFVDIVKHVTDPNNENWVPSKIPKFTHIFIRTDICIRTADRQTNRFAPRDARASKNELHVQRNTNIKHLYQNNLLIIIHNCSTF